MTYSRTVTQIMTLVAAQFYFTLNLYASRLITLSVELQKWQAISQDARVTALPLPAHKDHLRFCGKQVRT
jgi:hypothetical protein